MRPAVELVKKVTTPAAECRCEHDKRGDAMSVVNSKKDKAAELVYELLREIGENPDRDGLKATPERVSEALRYFTQGYEIDIDDIVAKAIFKEKQEEMVVLKDIDFYSLCEHHLVPFFGKCHIAYLPKDRIVGLSKLARVVDVFARRLQVQERMTREIAHAIERHLEPLGVAVVIEAQHLCMMMRGVEKQNSLATTSTMLGSFKDNAATRMEFFSLVGNLGKPY
jgi:GTP cyclohydrolase I